MHEIAELRKCATCRFASTEALAHNRDAHEREDWIDCDRPFCTYLWRLDIADDGTCRQHKELGE